MRAKGIVVACLVAVLMFGFVPMAVFAMEPVSKVISNPVSPKGTRTVLVESFTGLWCPYCQYETQANHQLEGEYSRDQVAFAEWHNGDKYSPADGSNSERESYYSIQGFPTVIFDGQDAVVGASSKASAYAAYKAKIDAHLPVAGQITITQTSSISGTNAQVDATIDAEQKSGTFTARILLIEYIGVLESGTHWVDYVIRRQLTKQSVTLTAGQTTSVSGSGAVDASWKQANLYSITFVQDDSTKVILNTNYKQIGGGSSDTEKPKITAVQHSPASPTDQDAVTITATITDNVGVSSATAYYDDGSGSKNKAMTGSGSTYTADIGKFTAGKTVTYHVEAKDAAGNTNQSTSASFSVVAGTDKTPPTITAVQHTPASPKDTDPVTISATITDNVGVTSGTVYYNDGSGLQNKAMTNSGSTYSGTIGPFAAGKKVDYYVEAKDAANNKQTSPSASFTVQGTADATKPTINGVAHTPASPTASDDVTVSATITDNVGVTTAEVKYNDGSGEKTATMTASGSTYSAKIGKFAAGATVTYHVEAKDAAGNLAKSTPDGSFTIPTTSQPPDVSVKEITYTPAAPKIGDKVKITVKVKNEGTGMATNVNVVFTVDGKTHDTKVIASIAPGATESVIAADWVAQTDGTKPIKVEATADGDTNTANDIMTTSFPVAKTGGGGSTGTSGTSAMLMWLLPIIIIAVVVVILLVLLMRRKKPAPQQQYYQQDMFGGGPQW